MQLRNLLVLGDLHLKLNNLTIADKLFACVSQLAIEHSVTDLVLLGDVYDTKAIIRSEVQNFLIDKLSSLQKQLKVHVLVGNHDYENLQCQGNALSPLRLLSNVKLYDEATVDREIGCAFIPFRATNQQFLEDVTAIGNFSNVKIVFCHQGFSSFDLGGGILDKTGVNVSDIPTSFKYVIGHYHAPQDSGNVVYLGTPFSHSFGEANQQKRVGLCSMVRGDIEFLQTSKLLPQHYKLAWSSQTQVFDDSSLQWLDKVKDGDFVELTVRCRPSEVERHDKHFIVTLFPGKTLELRLKYDLIDEQRAVRLQENLSLEQMLKQYLEVKGRPDSLQRGLGFLKDAVL